MSKDFPRSLGRYKSIDSYDDVIESCHKLIPILRSRIPEADELRRLPDSTCEDIRKTGIARILQPSRYGGLEAPLHSMIDVLVPIGVGCGSTSWVLAQYIMHNYMIARWSKQMQDEIWDEKPDALVSGILIPRIGRAKEVKNGIKLTGRWPWVTGIKGADWCILSGMVEKTATIDKEPVESYFMIPRDELTILDTWYGIGLKGTGSHDVQVDDLFVPKHRIVTVDDFKGGAFAGQKTNPGILYRPPVYMTFGILLTSSIIGMVKYMFNEYLVQSRNSITTMSGKESGTYQSQQIKIAEISAHIQSAEALLRQDCKIIMELAENFNYQPSDIERSNYRNNAAYAGRQAYQAAKLLWDLAGAKAAYTGNNIGRVFLDILVATRHVTQNFDSNGSDYGRAEVGLPLANSSL